MPKGKSSRVGKKPNKARVGSGMVRDAKRKLNERRSAIDNALESAVSGRVSDMDAQRLEEALPRWKKNQSTDSNN